MIAEKLQNLWSSDEVRILVLTSLSMQIALIFLAPLRKRITNIMLALALWLLYLTADNVATLGLGNISHQTPAGSAVSSELTILWAPFLLVHLGGPDTITSYSIEDNELWWRHLLGLLFQVIITVYIFIQSPPTGWLWIPTIFVFIPGLIKFAERTHALRVASKDNIKDKILSELRLTKSVSKGNTPSNTGQANETTIVSTDNTPSNAGQAKEITKGCWGNLMGNMGNLMGSIKSVLFPPEDTIDILVSSFKDISKDESELILEGFRWFNIFKRLLVDVTFSADLLMKSQDRFSDLSTTVALDLVAVELSFLYDYLHTKAVHMHCILGRALRYFSLVSIIAALIVFHHLDMQKYVFGDIIITYILFGVGLSLEVIATILLVFSDWTVVALKRTKQSECVVGYITALVKAILKKGKRRWAHTIGHFNLVDVCLRDRDTKLAKIMRILKIKNKWDDMRESKLIPLLRGGQLEEIMVTEAKRRAQNVHIHKVLVEARAYRGDKTLERHDQLKTLEWSMKREFDESIILWHLATDICYYEDETSNKSNGEKQKPSSQPNRENQEHSNQPDGENQQPSNQPNGENQKPSSQPNRENQEHSDQPDGENQQPSNQPNGENQEHSNQPNGENQEHSNQPDGENQQPSNQPNGENQQASNQPNGENQEHSDQPNERNEELSNQPNGRKKIPINRLKSCCSSKPNGENQQPSKKPCLSCLCSKQPNAKEDTERDVSWKTSNYMIYLLTQQQSMMQLGYGKTRFEATCSVVKKKLKENGKLKSKEKLDPRKAHDVLKIKKNEGAPQVSEQTNASESADGIQPTNNLGTSVLKKIWENLRRCTPPVLKNWGKRKREEDKRKREGENEMGEQVLRDSRRLAKELQEIQPDIKRWQLISETWMEMLGYAAIHCDSYQHAKSLSRGGELLTHLWLLMSQLGLVEEHKMQQYQSGSV